MITTHLRSLVGTANDRPWMGYAPGEAVVVDWGAGGGFAGAPQVLYIVTGFVNECPRVEFPPPGPSVEVRFGGHWAGAGIGSVRARIHFHHEMMAEGGTA